MGVNDKILAIRIMEKLSKFPDQADAFGIVVVNSSGILRERSSAERKIIKN